MEQRDSVVLVDKYDHDLFYQDASLSVVGEIEAYHCGLLHKAIFVFIFNDRNELLLQKRAVEKYYSPKKWANTYCTHPSSGECPLLAVQRRISEKMGLVASLTEDFTFSYQADVGNGLIKNEFVHVFPEVSNQNPNPAELSDWNLVTIHKGILARTNK